MFLRHPPKKACAFNAGTRLKHAPPSLQRPGNPASHLPAPVPCSAFGAVSHIRGLSAGSQEGRHSLRLSERDCEPHGALPLERTDFSLSEFRALAPCLHGKHTCHRGPAHVRASPVLSCVTCEVRVRTWPHPRQ